MILEMMWTHLFPFGRTDFSCLCWYKHLFSVTLQQKKWACYEVLHIKEFRGNFCFDCNRLRMKWQSQPWDLTEQMHEITWKKLKQQETRRIVRLELVWNSDIRLWLAYFVLDWCLFSGIKR